MKTFILSFYLLSICPLAAFSQNYDKEIHSKEGTVIGYRRPMIVNCKRSYGAPAGNKVVEQVCECQVNLLDRRFSNSKIRTYNRKYKGEALSHLIEEDTSLQRLIKECTSEASGLPLMSIPEYKKSFIDKCAQGLQTRSDKPINDTLAVYFCSCAADILEERKMSLDKMDDLSDPSSFLYNEVAYKCGSPYLQASDFAKDWKAADTMDVSGAVRTDSVQVLSLMGMHKVKITIGKETRIWLLDSGASDLLLSEDFLKTLKQQGIVKEMDFIGEGRYQVADGRVIVCKRYKINGVKIGRFVVNNVIIAASKEAKEFLVGKSLLNKFSQWVLDNRNNWLILHR